MDSTLKKLCSLLGADDVELCCAAARVLSEVAPRSREVRTALAARLCSAHPALKNCILSAIERNPGKEALPALFPLLVEGGAVAKRASGIISSLGTAAVSEAKKLFPKADNDLAIRLVAVLGMIGTPDACGFLIDRIGGADPEVRRAICLSLREAIAGMPREKKRGLLKKVNAFLSSPSTRERPEEAAAGVILLGFIADNATVGKLLKYAAAEHPVEVRKQALIALARMDLPSKISAEVARAAVPLLDEDDYPNIVRNALALLARVEIPKSLLPGMKEDLKDRHPSVRSFIISRMGRSGGDENISMLLSHLRSKEYQDRRAAQEALGRIPAAYPLIIKEMDAAKDYEVKMRLISILKAHKDRFNARDKRHLLTRMEKLWEAGDENYSIYATALKVVDPDFLTGRIMNRVKKLKSAKKYAQAEELLDLLVRHSLSSEVIDWELAVISLRNSSKQIAPRARKADRALKRIANLLSRPGFPLLRRLAREKALRPEDLFYLGYHFSEKLFKKREFGMALLDHLVETSPRSKAGSAAKKRLAEVRARA